MKADQPTSGIPGNHDDRGASRVPVGKPAPRAREIAAATVQHGLLFGFAAVAAGISAQGLTGFARDNMRLTGPWPYLLFFALDGAAGLCAVLLLRRAARGETAAAPRLAVCGLVAASSAAAPAGRDRSGGQHGACRGIQHVEAVSVAFVVCSRLGVDRRGWAFPHVASWAGSDPRARPGLAVRIATERIIAAAAKITAHLRGDPHFAGVYDAAAVLDLSRSPTTGRPSARRPPPPPARAGPAP